MSRKSYKRRSALNVGLDEDGQANGQPETRPESGYMCAKCRLILSRYEGIYKSLIHQGSELKKRKHVNPHPKPPDFVHYRDLKRQNEWPICNIGSRDTAGGQGPRNRH